MNIKKPMTLNEVADAYFKSKFSDLNEETQIICLSILSMDLKRYKLELKEVKLSVR